MINRLKRSDDKVVAGVCAGLAEYYGWDKSKVRLIYAFLSIFSAGFPGLLVYIILWFVMPNF
jgi:phage shock protein PspC (stress-responsive transcriptional regulator)